MRTIMARTPHESSFSLSKRHFLWKLGKSSGGEGEEKNQGEEEKEDEVLAFSTASSSSASCDDDVASATSAKLVDAAAPPPLAARKKVSPASAAASAVSKFRALLKAAIIGRYRPMGLGPRVTGTLFGHRRGHVHFAFQVDPRACPAVLIELATPTNALVREMASGLVRIALECDHRPCSGGGGRRLLEEPLWRAYCNGKKCGYAVRRECGPADWRVLRAVEPVSMGAGVLPAPKDVGCSGDGETMYMRARFERVVGSKDSEAFYMMNPDNNGGPELSIYLLRV